MGFLLQRNAGRPASTLVWRSLALSLVTIAFLAGCKRTAESQPSRTDSDLQQMLVGRWLFLTNSLGASNFGSTVVVSSNGNYVADLSKFSQTHYKQHHLEGTWKIENGFLVDTILKHSDTNAHLPIVSKDKVLRLSSNELVIRHEWTPSNFLDSVFERENIN